MVKFSFELNIILNRGFLDYLQLASCRLNSTQQVENCAKVKQNKTRMWADAQRDGRPAEYKWRLLRKFRNSIPCSTPQRLAHARCFSAMQ